MDISQLIQKIISQSNGNIEYKPESNGAIHTEILQQEIEKNAIMFKKSVEYLAHCLKGYDIELIERKKTHNMLEINLAIASINRYKSRFFLLLTVEEIFNEFFQEVEINAPTINVKDLNMKGIMRLSEKSSKKTLKIKNGGGRKRKGKNTMKNNSVSKTKYSMLKFLLMLMSFLSLITVGATEGSTEIINESPVGLYMDIEATNLARIKSDYAKVSVGFPYPTKEENGQEKEAFTSGQQKQVEGGPSILKPEYGGLTIPFTTVKLNDVENAVSNWASTTFAASTKEEKLSSAMASIMTENFNSISEKIQDKVANICTKLVKDIQLNKVFNEKEISDLSKYRFTPGTSSTSYLGVTTTEPGTEIHTFFKSTDLINYMKKLCSVPELRLDPFQNGDGTYTISLTRFGLPRAEELFTNLTIATGDHLLNLIQKSEKIYMSEMKKKGIEKIETDFSLITKDSIRRTFLLNLQEKISLYKILIDNIVSDQQSLSEIFIKYNKASSTISDITKPEDLQNFLDSIQNKNKDILKDLETTMLSEEYSSETPFNLKEFKNTEILVEAQLKTLEQMEVLKQDNLETQRRLIDDRRKQQDIILNASRTEKAYEQAINKDTMAGYMNTIFSYGEGLSTPIWNTAGNVLATGSEGFQSLLNGAGGLLGGSVSSLLVGLSNGLFGSWSWLAGLTFLSGLPLILGAYVAWKIGGIQLAFRIVGAPFYYTYAIITYLPRKVFVAIYSRRSNGSIVSHGTMGIPNPQNLLPGSSSTLPIAASPSAAAIREISSDEARRIGISEKIKEANRRAREVEKKLKFSSMPPPSSMNVGGKRYRKRTYKRKHNKKSKRTRRK